MAYRIEGNELIIDGFEKGIAASPYTGIANMRNVNTNYYPSVAYVNYKRQAATLSQSSLTEWYAGAHSTSIRDNAGWLFEAPVSGMTNPIQHATSPAGLNYILDDSGQVWKQSAVNSSTFNLLGDGGRYFSGAGGIAYWNNYIVVFGDGAIEFCGDGTGDTGITGANWNISNNGGLNVNTITTNNELFLVNSPAAGDTSATMTSPWIYATGNYNFHLGSGQAVTGIFTQDDTLVLFSALPPGTYGQSNFTLDSNYILLFQNGNFDNMNVGDAVTFSTTGTLPAPLTANTNYYISDFTQGNINYLSNQIMFSVSDTQSLSSTPISITGASSPTTTMTDSTTPFPVGNVTDVVFAPTLANTTSPINQLTSLRLQSYTNPAGISVNAPWQEPSGNYELIDSWGNKILVTMTNGSTIMSLIQVPIDYLPTGTYNMQLLNSDVTDYRPYVSKADGNLYFANGRYVGRILSNNPNANFNPGDTRTYIVDFGAFSVLDPNDSVTDMTDLSSTLIVSGQNKIYTWDYVSPSTTAPVPIADTPIKHLLNLLNIVYIFAGQKGNVYVSNGSYAQLLTKIPDNIAGVIDPVWNFGGVMSHRSRIFFQALAQDTSGNNLLAGIFSVLVSPSLLGEIAQGVTMENQNSYGLAPAAGATGAGILIDDEPSASGQDSYYSAWSDGVSTGGIDFNDTTLWNNFEPTIDTDIIPIGTFLDKRSLGQFQFKLDRPLVSGDQINFYARSSLSDSWTQIGSTETGTLLADAFPSNLAQQQWLQFRIQMKCAASGSSFIPLREVRVQLT